MVSGEPPLTQHRQDQGAGGGLQETEQRTHTHHYRQDTCGAGKQLLSSSAFTSLRISHGLLTQTQCWRRHTTVPLLPETAEEVWNKPQYPQILLHLHCGEHPDRLHHRLVWKQHRWQPQGSAKGRANCPPHCWSWASLPPGHLHQAVFKEARRIIKDSSHPSH